jgi:hypothetical protein
MTDKKPKLTIKSRNNLSPLRSFRQASLSPLHRFPQSIGVRPQSSVRRSKSSLKEKMRGITEEATPKKETGTNSSWNGHYHTPMLQQVLQ